MIGTKPPNIDSSPTKMDTKSPPAKSSRQRRSRGESSKQKVNSSENSSDSDEDTNGTSGLRRRLGSRTLSNDEDALDSEMPSLERKDGILSKDEDDDNIADGGGSSTGATLSPPLLHQQMPTSSGTSGRKSATPEEDADGDDEASSSDDDSSDDDDESDSESDGHDENTPKKSEKSNLKDKIEPKLNKGDGESKGKDSEEKESSKVVASTRSQSRCSSAELARSEPANDTVTSPVENVSFLPPELQGISSTPRVLVEESSDDSSDSDSSDSSGSDDTNSSDTNSMHSRHSRLKGLKGTPLESYKDSSEQALLLPKPPLSDSASPRIEPEKVPSVLNSPSDIVHDVANLSTESKSEDGNQTVKTPEAVENSPIKTVSEPESNQSPEKSPAPMNSTDKPVEKSPVKETISELTKALEADYSDLGKSSSVTVKSSSQNMSVPLRRYDHQLSAPATVMPGDRTRRTSESLSSGSAPLSSNQFSPNRRQTVSSACGVIQKTQGPRSVPPPQECMASPQSNFGAPHTPLGSSSLQDPYANPRGPMSVGQPPGPHSMQLGASAYGSMETLDVQQLGLESPHSMHSTDMNNPSVETSFADCAQQVQPNYHTSAAVGNSPAASNYMETVNHQMSSPMNNPHMTSPTQNQQFTMPNPSPGGASTQQQPSNYNLPNPSPGQPGYSLPQPSPGGSANYGMPQSSPSNQTGVNYNMPNPSPAGSQNYNVAHPSPGAGNNAGGGGNLTMPTPSPTNSNHSFNMAAPSPSASGNSASHGSYGHPQAPSQNPHQMPPPSTAATNYPSPSLCSNAPNPVNVPYMGSNAQQLMALASQAASSGSTRQIQTQLSAPGNLGYHHSPGSGSNQTPGGPPPRNYSLAKLQQLTNGLEFPIDAGGLSPHMPPASPTIVATMHSSMTPPPAHSQGHCKNVSLPSAAVAGPHSQSQQHHSHQAQHSQHLQASQSHAMGQNIAGGGHSSQAQPSSSQQYASSSSSSSTGGGNNGKYQRQRSHQKTPAPNVTVNPSMASFHPHAPANMGLHPHTQAGSQMLSGYNMSVFNMNGLRMQQAPINPHHHYGYPPNMAAFMNQPNLAAQMQMAPMVHPAHGQHAPSPQQMQAAAAHANNPAAAAAMYQSYGYINGAGIPQPFNGVMRR